ncbi:NADH dehydrogenase [ubiquinone] 1 beta subcomplex subunit 4 [Bufo bufo]|uniref:NADH dehydrogenase [ubiquinone] 1 beta subcomplex subunit 4 n=1 Tax=Bufo bufo TaxID=8384 RepID=UPI001ABE2775|nr:NADH dehydrogenase [ubiquinone] 1 beta subcomplex subunit 4 [Bufo bufo]
MAEYKESPLASRPAELDPARYFGQTLEQKRLQEKREALRAQVKREYLLKLNNPHRIGMVEDPAITRWMYARNHNIYPNFRPMPKNSLLGLLWTAGPFFFFYGLISHDRDRKEKLIKEGKYERPFHLSN